jgi:hypothetical protein
VVNDPRVGTGERRLEPPLACFDPGRVVIDKASKISTRGASLVRKLSLIAKTPV